MKNDEQLRFFRLHFEGVGTQNHTLPANALVVALQQMQRVVHLLAMSRDGKEVRQRARVTKDIEKRFPLVCQVPENGGYALPVTIGDTSGQLCDVYGIEELAQNTRKVLESINEGSVEKLSRIVPESYYRKCILAAFKGMQPPKRSGVIVNIEDYRKNKLLDGSIAKKHIEKFISPPEADIVESLGYVTGSLIEMKFQERRLKLQLRPSQRALEATYSDDFEPILLDHPRELIQVHGNIVYGDDGVPLSVSEVDEILEVDEDPVDILQFEVSGRTLKPKNPLSFQVSFDPDKQFYEVEGCFDIILGANTRPEVEEQLYSELAMLWDEYAKCPDNKLTSSAQKLKSELLDAFEEVHDAS